MHIEHGLFRLHFFLRFWQSRHASFLASFAGLWGEEAESTEPTEPIVGYLLNVNVNEDDVI